MPIQFKCSSCKANYEVTDDLAGKPIICRECNHRGQVPGSAAPTVTTKSTVTFVCPTCGKPSQVPAATVGSKVRCLGCGKLGQVSAASLASGLAGAGSGDLLTRRTIVGAAVVCVLLMGSAATGAFLARWHPKHERTPRTQPEDGQSDTPTTDKRGKRGRRGPPGAPGDAGPGGPPANPPANPPAPQG